MIREDFTIEAYDILELHCELVAERMRLVASQKDVPPDMDQAISTLIWAADRAEVLFGHVFPAFLPFFLPVRTVAFTGYSQVPGTVPLCMCSMIQVAFNTLRVLVGVDMFTARCLMGSL